MNNFFLRPWARGPVFGGDEEGGGGGGDDSESNREASTGGAAATPVDPFARSARTKARISTGRQDNINNRFANIPSDGPSYGSEPPSVDGYPGTDATGTIPSSLDVRSGSGAPFNNIISGNDDPDFLFENTKNDNYVFDESDESLFGGRFSGQNVGRPLDTFGRVIPAEKQGILTGLGNLLVSPADGQTILGRSRNKALAASGDLDGINPQGPTYTPTDEPSFLDNVLSTAGIAGNYVYNAINPLSPTDSVGGDAALALDTANRLAKGGIKSAYSAADAVETGGGKFLESLPFVGYTPPPSTQYYADKRAYETGAGPGLIPQTALGAGNQYFDAFGSPVGNAEGIRRADKLREDLALRSARDRRVGKAKQSNIDAVTAVGGDNTSSGNAGMYDAQAMKNRFLSSASNFFQRPEDLGGTVLPSATAQNLNQAALDSAIKSGVVVDNLSEENKRALGADLSFTDPNALAQKVFKAAPSAFMSMVPAMFGNAPLSVAAGTTFFGGESGLDRTNEIIAARESGKLQMSPEYQGFMETFGGDNDLALNAAIAAADKNSAAGDALLGASVGYVESKLFPGNKITKNPIKVPRVKPTGREEVFDSGAFDKMMAVGPRVASSVVTNPLVRRSGIEAYTEGDLEQRQMLANLRNMFGEESGFELAPLSERVAEGITAAVLAGGSTSGAANVDASGINSGSNQDLSLGPGKTINLNGGQTGTALTTPVNTGIAGLQPESNQGPLVGEVLTPFGPNRPKTGTETQIINDAEIIYDAPINANEFGGTQSIANQSVANNLANRIAPPANEFSGTQSLANQAVFNNLAGRTSPTPNDLAGTNIVDPATTAALQAQAELAARNRDASTGGAASTVFADNAPIGPSNPLVSEILAGRNIPTAPNTDTRNALDPVGGLGPSGGRATGFVDNAPIGPSNPLVSEILAGRNIPTAPDITQSFNPTLGESVNSQVILPGPNQDAIFTPEGTTINPVSNVVPSNEQGTNYTPPALSQRGPDVDPDVIQAMYRNQEMTQAEASRLALLAQQAEAARMEAANNIPTEMVGPANMTRTQLENNQLLGQFEQAKADFAAQTASNNQLLSEFEQAKADFARMQAANNIPTNTLENIMNDIVLESNTGNNLTPVSNVGTRVIPTAPNMDTRFDPTIDPLTGEVLSPEITKYTAPKAKRVLPTIDGVVTETNSDVMLNPPVTTAVTIDSTLNPNTVLETNPDLSPFSAVTVLPPDDGSGDDEINIPTFPDDTSGDDDVTTPPDENGNCPPGYIMKFINGMYICVPIEEGAPEEEEEEEEVVTYGRPRAGSYYQPRTVAPISPYILNSDEV